MSGPESNRAGEQMSARRCILNVEFLDDNANERKRWLPQSLMELTDGDKKWP